MVFADSGRLQGLRQGARAAPEKSNNFSQTCTLLSKYLKEKKKKNMGSSSFAFGDHVNQLARINFHGNYNNGMAAEKEETTKTTMDLFPQQSGASVFKEQPQLPVQAAEYPSSVNNKLEQGTAQMTIFYGGQVIVFNDFPADKAEQLMLLASKEEEGGGGATTHAPSSVQNPTEPPINLIPNHLGNNMINQAQQSPPHQTPAFVVSDLPIARKASLTRFLEKRRDRITARAPYTLHSPETKSWLRLAPQPPTHLHHCGL